MSKTKSKGSRFLIQNSILAAVSMLLLRIIELFYRIPVTNMIGEEGMGEYGIAFEFYQIFIILTSFGLPVVISKMVAAKTKKKEYRNSYNIFLRILFFGIVTGTAASLFTMAVSAFLAKNLFWAPDAAIPMRILSAAILINTLAGALKGFFQGKGSGVPSLFSIIIEQIINGVVSISSAYLFMKAHSASEHIGAYGAGGAAFGTAAGAFAGFLFLLFVFCLYRPTINKQVKKEKNMKFCMPWDTFFTLLFPVIFCQLIFQLHKFLDNILFVNLSGSDLKYGSAVQQLGIYFGKAGLLLNLPVAVLSAAAVLMAPPVILSYVKQDFGQVKLQIHKMMWYEMFLAFPITCYTAFLAGPMISIFFPGSSAAASALLRYGAVAILGYGIFLATSEILQAFGCFNIILWNSFLSLIIHAGIVLFCLRILHLEIFSLTAGMISYPFITGLLNLAIISKRLEYRQELFKTVCIPFLASVIMGGSAFIIYKGLFQLTKGMLFSFIVSSILSLLLYLFLFFLLKGGNKEDLEDVPFGNLICRIVSIFHIIE